MIAYFTALLLTQLLGRKLLSQMTFFDFVVGVATGSALVNTSLPNTAPSGYIVLVVIFILTIFIDITHIKNFSFRKIVASEPVVVVENGQIVNQNLEKIRLSTEELLMKLREKNAFNIADVEFAVMEFDGQLSVQPKSQKQPVTPSDLNLSTPYRGLTRDLIIDGEIIQENLGYVNLNEEWLNNEL